jgi:hypothetical protein
MMPNGFIQDFENGFAPVKIFQSSKVSSTILESPIYHGFGNASMMM